MVQGIQYFLCANSWFLSVRTSVLQVCQADYLQMVRCFCVFGRHMRSFVGFRHSTVIFFVLHMAFDLHWCCSVQCLLVLMHWLRDCCVVRLVPSCTVVIVPGLCSFMFLLFDCFRLLCDLVFCSCECCTTGWMAVVHGFMC